MVSFETIQAERTMLKGLLSMIYIDTNDQSYLPSDRYLNVNDPLAALPIIFEVQFKYYITYLKIDIDDKVSKTF